MAATYTSKDEEEEKKKQEEAADVVSSAAPVVGKSVTSDVLAYSMERLGIQPSTTAPAASSTAASAAATVSAPAAEPAPAPAEPAKAPTFGDVKTGSNTYDFSWADDKSDQWRMQARLSMASDPDMLAAYDEYIIEKGYAKEYQREPEEWEILGRLKDKGLVGYNGQQFDIMRSDFSGLVNAVRMIPDTATRKAAYKDLKALTKVKGGRFDKYWLSGDDPGYLDTRDMPESGYKDFIKKINAQFYRSSGHEKENAGEYLRLYQEIHGELSGLTDIQKYWYKKALDDAYIAQTGLQPDRYKMLQLTGTAQKAKTGETKNGADEEGGFLEWLTDLYKDAKDSVGSAVDGVMEFFGGDEETERRNAEIQPEPLAAPEAQGPAYQPPEPAPTPTIDQQIAAGATPRPVPAEAREAQGPAYQPPEPKSLDEQMAGKAVAAKANQPEEQKPASGSVNLVNNLAAAIEYAEAGRYEELDEETQAALNSLRESAGPGGLVVLGELAPELYKTYQTGNEVAYNLQQQNIGMLGSDLAKIMLRIQSEDFPAELRGDAKLALLQITQAAENDPTITPEILAVWGSRYAYYTHEHPECLNGFNYLFEQLDGMRADAAEHSAQQQAMEAEELENARFAVRTYSASEAQRQAVLDAAPDMDSVMAMRDRTYAQMYDVLQTELFSAYGSWGEDSPAIVDTYVYKTMRARGVEDMEKGEGEYEFLLGGTMEALLMEDMRIASSLGMSLGDYYNGMGGMDVDLLAQRASARILNLGKETNAEEVEQVRQTVDKEASGLGLRGLAETTTEHALGSIAEGALESVIMVSAATDRPNDIAKVTIDFNHEYGPWFGRSAYSKTMLSLADSGKMPPELAKSVKEYLATGEDPYKLGLNPKDFGWTMDTYATLRGRNDFLEKMVESYGTESEQAAFNIGDFTTYNTVLMLASGITAAALAPVAGPAAPFLGMRAVYGGVQQGAVMQEWMGKGYTLTESYALSEAQLAAESAANMISLGRQSKQLTGYAALLNKSLVQSGGARNPGVVKTFWTGAKMFGGAVWENILDETLKDPFLEKTMGAAATSAVADVIQDKREGRDVNALKSGLVGIFAGAESVPGAVEELIREAPATFMASLPLAIIGAGGETIRESRSYKAAQDVISRGDSDSMREFIRAVTADSQDQRWMDAMQTEKTNAEIESEAAANLALDPEPTLYTKAQKTREQVESHKATLRAATAANGKAIATMAQKQADLDAGSTDPQVVVDLNEAQEAFAKSRQTMNESGRELAQKKVEAHQAEQALVQDAHDKAVLEVNQKHAAAKEAAQVAADVSQYETLTGDDTIRRVNLDENMRTMGFANQREDFADAIDSWDGEQKGLSFVLGKTSEVLAANGVPKADIVIQSDKLAKIKKKHPAMSDDVIKQIPDVVENPVVLMTSNTVPGRITMFANVKDEDGAPVLAVVSMNPKTNMVTGVNFVEVNSAYGKNTMPQDFINKSKVLYVDKNRAAEWEVSTGLQLPVEPSASGSSSTNIVPQAQKNDKPEIDADYRGIDGDVLQPTPTTGRARRNPVQTFKRLSRDLGLGQTMGTKKMNDVPQEVAGYYQRGAQYLATRNNFGSSIEVTAHEIGHAVSDRLRITGTDQMVANLGTRFTTNYRPDQLRGEAFAEFFWRYMVSDEAAINFAGDTFVADMERRLRQEHMLRPVKRAQREIRRYLNAATDQRIRMMIRDRSDKNRDLTIDEKFADMERKFITAMVDSTRPAEDVNAAVRERTGENHIAERLNLRNAALMQSTAPRRAWGNLTRNLTDVHGTIIGDSLQARFRRAGIRGENFDLLNEYMLAKHSLARDRQNKPVFDRQSITGRDTREFIREVERDHPEVAAAARAFQEFRHDFMMAYMVNTGYMTADTLDLFETMYSDYVPTYRVKDRGGRGAGGQTYEIRRASGSTEEIINPMDSFVEMVNTIVAMNLRNETAKTWDRVYRQFDGMGIFGREVTEDQRLTIMNMEATQEQVRQILDDAGEADDVIQQVLDTIGTEQYRRSGTGDVNLPNIVTVQMPTGERRFYEMFDQELFDMLAGTEDSGISALEILGKVTRTMSALTTGSNPIFAVRNFMRDYQNSVNYGSWASNYAQGAYRWLHSAYNVWRENGGYDQYAALGGGGWTQIKPQDKKSAEEYRGELFRGYNTSNIRRAGRWAGRKIWNGVTAARLNEIVEQASRFAEYKYGQHDLTTPEGRQAAYLAAQDVTTDFSRRGSSRVAREVKMVVPFFNASLQGIYRTGRQVTEGERDRAPTRFMKTVVNTGLASALAAGLMLRNLDEEEKEEFFWLSDDLKAKHMYLPNFAPDVLGDAPLIRIPLPQDPLSYAVHAAVTNAMWSGQGDEWAVALSAVADNILNSFSPINSTSLDPIISMSTNKNWYGSNIVPRSMDGWYVTNQYAATTPTAFVNASQVLDGVGVGISPMMLQYLAEQYSGYIGQLAIPFFSKNEHTGETEGISATIEKVRKTLTSDPLISQEIISSVYDSEEFLTSVTKAGNNKRSMDMLRTGLTQYEARTAYDEAYDMTHSGGTIYEAKKFMTNGYKRIDEIEANPELSEEEKYLMTSDIRREMIELALDANEEMAVFRERYVEGESFLGRFMKGTTIE